MASGADNRVRPLLQAKSIAKHYDGVAALSSTDVSLFGGEVLALMGENGAGKSTLARIMAGSEQPDGGSLYIDGEEVTLAGPLAAQAYGIAIIYQELDLFPHLTVGENIVVGNLRFNEGAFANPRAIEKFCSPFLDQVGLLGTTSSNIAEMPIGHQQLVAIARAVSMQCRVLLMDEPTSALSEDSAERLFEVIDQLRKAGVAVGYVSHKMDEIFRLCDRVTVLRDGRTIETLATKDTDREGLIRLMVGRAVDLSSRSERDVAKGVLLSVDHLATEKLRQVSFHLRRGEVLGVAGLVGAGRSELGAALVGLDPVLGGRMTLDGALFTPSGPADARRRGVVLLPEDRKLQGLMLAMSVQENASMAILPRLAKAGFIDRAREKLSVKRIAKRLRLKCATPEIRVGALSGGNQQKALLARWLLADPDLLFLDDPARGIDVGAKEDIYETIDALAAAGKSLIMASSELPELLRCCDRILVLRDGELAAVFDGKDATQEAIMAAATHETDDV